MTKALEMIFDKLESISGYAYVSIAAYLLAHMFALMAQALGLLR